MHIDINIDSIIYCNFVFYLLYPRSICHWQMKGTLDLSMYFFTPFPYFLPIATSLLVFLLHNSDTLSSCYLFLLFAFCMSLSSVLLLILQYCICCLFFCPSYVANVLFLFLSTKSMLLRSVSMRYTNFAFIIIVYTTTSEEALWGSKY